MGVMRCVPGDNLAKLKSALFTLLLPGMNRKSKTAYYRLCADPFSQKFREKKNYLIFLRIFVWQFACSFNALLV